VGVTQFSVTGMAPFSGWQNFYVIVGSSAGALIGLQFVVMALVADLPRTAGQAQAGHAFRDSQHCSFRSGIVSGGSPMRSMALARQPCVGDCWVSLELCMP
jgi:hypothetical protein